MTKKTKQNRKFFHSRPISLYAKEIYYYQKAINNNGNCFKTIIVFCLFWRRRRRTTTTTTTTTLLISTKILERVQETWADLLSLQENTKNNNKYLDLARELKKLWNMKVTLVPIVIGALGTITKGLLKGLEDLEIGGRVETIQTTALLRTARILRRVLETWGDLLSLKLQCKTIS